MGGKIPGTSGGRGLISHACQIKGLRADLDSGAFPEDPEAFNSA